VKSRREPRTCLRSATDFWMSGSARLMQFRVVLEIELYMLPSLSDLCLRFALLLLAECCRRPLLSFFVFSQPPRLGPACLGASFLMRPGRELMLADWSRMVEAGLGGGRESIERKASGKGCKSESQYRLFGPRKIIYLICL
jgi:hypothetical protein